MYTLGSTGIGVSLFVPGYENFDLSLTNSTPLRLNEGSRLDSRAEFFNLFNRANLGVPSSLQVLNPVSPQYIAGAGRISNTVNPSRQMQFGLN